MTSFLAERVFGPHRRELLAAELADADTTAQHARGERIDALRRELADNHTRRRRLIRSLELADDPYGDLTADVQERLAELRTERQAATAELHDLEHAAPPAPTPALLDAVPLGALDLARLPDQHARALYDALRLRITYDRRTNAAHCQITLATDTLPAVLDTLTTAHSNQPATHGKPAVPMCDVPPVGFEPTLWPF